MQYMYVLYIYIYKLQLTEAEMVSGSAQALEEEHAQGRMNHHLLGGASAMDWKGKSTGNHIFSWLVV